MSLFRRDRRRPPAPTADPGAPEQTDSPEALRRVLYDAVRLINQNSGHLPAVAVVEARRLTDTIREIIGTSDVRPLDVYAVITIRSTLTDYLPTTLRSYLAVDDELRDVPRPGGMTASESLLEQIRALQTSADLQLTAAQNVDVNALMTQGNFLRTKFAGSDLDL